VIRDDQGASSVEYGILLAAIAAVVVVAAVALGGVAKGTFTDSCDTFQTTRAAYDSNATASC
jgi:pilus assembly protein Flp/PilA